MMIVPYTSEIVASRALSKCDPTRWIAWAEKMIVAGFESDSLNILVGEQPPYSAFEFDSLFDACAEELGIPAVSSREDGFAMLTAAIGFQLLNGHIDQDEFFRVLYPLSLEEIDESSNHSMDFFLLYHARDDIAECGEDRHWCEPGERLTLQTFPFVVKEVCHTKLSAFPLAEWNAFEWSPIVGKEREINSN